MLLNYLKNRQLLIGLAGLCILLPSSSCTNNNLAQVSTPAVVQQEPIEPIKQQVTVEGDLLLYSLPNGQFFTSSQVNSLTHFWDGNGNELAQFDGLLMTGPLFNVSVDGKLAIGSTVTGVDGQQAVGAAGIWTLAGEELTETIRGDRPNHLFSGFTPQNGYTLWYDEATDTTTLVDNNGAEQSRLEGRILDISGDEMLWVTRAEIPDRFQYQYRLLDADGNLLSTFEAEAHQFLPDQQRLLTYSYGENGIGTGGATAQLWDNRGQKLADFAGEPSFDVLTNEQISFARPLEGNIYLMATDGQELGNYKGFLLAVTPDGKVATQTQDEAFTNVVHLWEPGAPFPVRLQNEELEALLPTGTVVTYQSDNNFQGYTLWDFNGTEMATLSANKFFFLSPDQQHLFTVVVNEADEDETVLWDRAGQELARFEGSVMEFTKDGRLATYAWGENKIHLWQLDQF